MITKRDLDTIGARPTDSVRSHRDLHDDPVTASSEPRTVVSTTAVVAVTGPCREAALAELRARMRVVLDAGVQHLVVDLSAATQADAGLLRTLGQLHREVDEHQATMALVGVPADEVMPFLHTASVELALLIYRSVQPVPIGSVPVQRTR
jgi:anti-anti-sigma regulatory factor